MRPGHTACSFPNNCHLAGRLGNAEAVDRCRESYGEPEEFARQIEFVNGKLVGMDAQMFQPDCLSFSGEIRKQQIIEDTEAATRDIQDNIDIEGLIQIIGTFISSKVKLLGLLEEELEEKNTREKSLRKCFDQNLNYHFQSTT